MESNALYFPYIRVPQSIWFTRMLLYWDSIGTIVPYEFFQNPEALGEHTRGLLERELVRPIPPGRYIEDIPAFHSAFSDYLEGPGIHIEQRRRRAQEGQTLRIHIEKMGPIEDLLVGLNLARVQRYPWFDVERDTANEFMAYLAGCLGRVPDINSMPVTDSDANLRVFLESERRQNEAVTELNHLRIAVIERVFPAPDRALEVGEIESFKLRHGEKLRAFRRAVEREILKLANLREAVHRQRQIEVFADEIHELAEDLDARFREAGFVKIVLGKICPLLGAIPGAPFVFGLANAVYKAFGGGGASTPTSPLAYAAYAQVELLGQGDTV